MKKLLIVLILSTGFLQNAALQAADKDLASALAAAGAIHAAKGNQAQATDLFYKALANDEQCPDAIFELAKILEKEGDTSTAADFYQRACLLFSQDPKANAAKRGEAAARLKVLNPFAPRLSAAYEEYAVELDRVAKKGDALTSTSALERVCELKLNALISPDKLPKFLTTALADKEKAEAEKVAAAKKNKNGESQKPEDNPHEKTGVTAPDVERELKALGWATVKGAFVKKGPGIYQATDARLEAPKMNGAINFIIVKEGNKGTVKASVRTNTQELSADDTYQMSGYGFNCGAKEYKVWGPAMNFGEGNVGTVHPVATNGSFPMPETPKAQFLVTVIDGAFEYFVNDKKAAKLNHNKTPKSGTFVIDVIGTVVIESPKCMGQ